MGQIRSVIIGALALACVSSLDATESASYGSVDKLGASRGTLSGSNDRKRVTGATRLLRVENVRLEAPVHAETLPSTLLKFDVFNGASTPLTDLILEISILREARVERTVRQSARAPIQDPGTCGPAGGLHSQLRDASSESVVGLQVHRHRGRCFSSMAARCRVLMVRPSNDV